MSLKPTTVATQKTATSLTEKTIWRRCINQSLAPITITGRDFDGYPSLSVLIRKVEIYELVIMEVVLENSFLGLWTAWNY